MKVFCAILIFLITATRCENRGNSLSQLEMIDSLSLHGNDSSANSELAKIETSILTEDDEKALCGIIKTNICNLNGKHGKSGSLIDESIKYYKGTGNAALLARSQYYKGIKFLFLGKEQIAIMWIKQAEDTKRNACLAWRDNIIFHNMPYINRMSRANAVALEYARKQLKTAEESSNTEWICDAYNRIAICYYELGKTDSAFYILRKQILT